MPATENELLYEGNHETYRELNVIATKAKALIEEDTNEKDMSSTKGKLTYEEKTNEADEKLKVASSKAEALLEEGTNETEEETTALKEFAVITQHEASASEKTAPTALLEEETNEQKEEKTALKACAVITQQEASAPDKFVPILEPKLTLNHAADLKFGEPSSPIDLDDLGVGNRVSPIPIPTEFKFGPPPSPMHADEDPQSLFGFNEADLKKPIKTKETQANDTCSEASWMQSLASSQDSVGSWTSSSSISSSWAKVCSDEPAPKVCSEEPEPKRKKVINKVITEGQIFSGKCHNCNQPGHWAGDCKLVVSKMSAGRDSKCPLCPHTIFKGDAIVKLGTGPFTYHWVHRPCGMQHLVKIGMI